MGMIGSYDLPLGPNCSIEAVGLHYAKSWVQEALVEAEVRDPSEMLNEIIYCTRKGGRIGVVGVYANDCDGYNIEAFMEKGLSMAAGQTPCQKYWPQLLKMVDKGILDPTMVITHTLSLDDAPYAYQIFNDKLDNCKKVILKTGIPSTRKPEE
ncbi:hypothetical protein WJX72_007377 [[Myrmecia] bisecta]|uniref:Alcohol dehydrogenase-like C-terminal domain-containing protein n=1 Tax=[Myrmecia] bisecta TaxID=41462 RepID=A0AAW1Q787_9CHLO